MKLGCLAGVEYKNKVIFSPMYTNGIFELNLSSGEVRLIKMLEKEGASGALFRKAVIYKNEAWFIPQKSNYIVCMDVESYKISYIPLQYRTKYNTSSDYPYYYAFIDCIIIREMYLVCVPSGIDSVIIINLETHEQRVVYGISNPEIDKVHSAVMIDDELYLISQNGTSDCVIALDGNYARKINLSFDHQKYSSLICNKNNIFLIPNNQSCDKQNHLCVYNYETKRKSYFNLPSSGESYYGGIAEEQFVLLFPYNGTKILKFDIYNSCFTFINYPEQIATCFMSGRTIAIPIHSCSRVLVSLPIEGYILEFNSVGEITNYYDVRIMNKNDSNTFIREYKHKNRNGGAIFSEFEPFMVEDFLQILSDTVE